MRIESVFRHVPADMLAFTTTERADLNTAIMHLLSVVNERLATALTFDEVLAGLPEVGWCDPVSDAELADRLTTLVGYGLLDRARNHSAQYFLGGRVRAQEPAVLVNPKG
ncbi:DUF2397 family protein [Phytohabitans kaempferiae]|uniref:DUF2397 family protein n=1 Tax=Phytohabitans kaempferiae TaxID=1620943 RepID=A0ABV6MAC3_9ACTN